MDITFAQHDYFDLQEIACRDIFTSERVWETLPRIEDYITEQFESGRLVANYKGEKNIFIGEGTVLTDGALIEGPVIIGKNCHIGHGSYLRGGVILEDNVHIGHGSEVKHSIILRNSAIAHLNYVGDSIVGSDVNIGGGAKTANFRLDGKTIMVHTNKEKIDTGLTKFGAIIGDNSKLGVNSVLNPGTILGKHVLVYPLKAVLGLHPTGETIT